MKKAVRTLKSQAGFSLIELMIVVAIIGILASIAVPNFQKFQRRAKQSEGKGYLSGVYTAENGFRAEWSQYTSDLKCIGFKDTQITANAADGISGKGSYVVGFAAFGTYPTGATCGAGFETAKPVPGPLGIPALAGAATPTTTSFTVATTGTLGGATNDQWTMDNNKALSNTASGL